MLCHLIVDGRLCLRHDAQQVTPPDFSYFFFRIACLKQAYGDVYQFTGSAAPDEFPVSVEIRTDAHVVDANQLHDVIQMADGIAEGGFLRFFVDEAFV